MAKVYAIISGKGGVGKSLAYSEYVSLANGDVIQIGPYIDNLIEKNKGAVKFLLYQTNAGQEIFEVLEPSSELMINIVRYENELKSERNSPIYLMRKPAPKELVKIITTNGPIQVTKEHKFLVMRDGNFKKIRAEELIPKKDYLLTFNYPLISNKFEEGSLSVSRLLGYLIGDGYIEKRNDNCLIHIFSKDSEDSIKNITTVFNDVFGKFSFLKDKRNNVCRISFFETKKIKELFELYGVNPVISSLKEIPKKIFSLNNNCVREFLSALYDCDGHVCKNRNEIQYDTKSEKLAYQISNLIKTRFKIENQLKIEYKRATNGKREKEKYFRLNISGEDIYKFYLNIGFKNKNKQDRLLDKIKHSNYNTNIKLFPIGKILKAIREESGVGAKKIAEILGCTKQIVYEYEWGFYALPENSVYKYIKAFKKLGISNEKLKFIEKILNLGYSFRRVEKKEKVDYNKKYVYDFQVCEEGGHFTHGTGIVISNTTTAINLGISLNHLGEEVMIVDANLTTPNIGIHLGAPIVPTTLNHVLNNQAKLEDAIYEHESGTKIMPASLSLKETEKIKYNRLSEVVKGLKKITSHILIDCAAGLGREAKAAIESADEIVIVTNPEMAAVTDALKTIKLAEEMNKPVKGVIITRYRGKETDMSISNIQEMLETTLLGIIPEEESIRESQVMKNAVIYTHPKSQAARTYLATSRRFMGEDIKVELPIKLGIIRKTLRKLGF